MTEGVTPSLDPPNLVAVPALLPVDELAAALEQIETLEAQVATLKIGLGTRGLIGEAIGITMAERGLDELRALEFLVGLSSHWNVKLREIAAGIVEAANRKAPVPDEVVGESGAPS